MNAKQWYQRRSSLFFFRLVKIDMQGINSLLDHQNQPSMHHFGNDDFLDQMLSSLLKSPYNPFHFDQPDPCSSPIQGGDGSLYNHHPQGCVSQSPAAQPKQRVRARRGQATDPHSIAERLRRERIADRMKGLQELVPNANKTDKASMLDEIIDYVKFLQLQVKVLSMSRLGGAAVPSEGGGGKDGLTVTEQQVAKLMEEDMGSAMQYLQGKGLCLMPISLATAISTSTRNPNHIFAGDAPSSPANVKDAASVSKP